MTFHALVHLRRPAGALLVAGLAVAALAGCSAGSQPAGISGQQAQQLNSSQYTTAEKEAALVLKPAADSFLAGKTTVTRLGSTTPANGDVNPYAIWPVTRNVGTVKSGDVLVDNFNNASNDQGTGATIVDVHPNGSTTVFAQLPQSLPGCPGGVGLTTAMVQLTSGWVIVGSLPSADGLTNDAKPGCLVEISPTGKLGGILTGSYIDGPWDATVDDNGTTPQLFVTNTLVGGVATTTAEVKRGTVVRLTLTEGTATTAPKVTAESTLITGIPERADAASFVKGPTGLALGSSGTLYVSDNLDNAILKLPDAVTATTAVDGAAKLTSGGQLAGPLGLTVAPNGDLIAANSANGKVVEISPAGRQLGEFYANQDVGQDPAGNGDLFGIAIDQARTGVLLVGDDNNDLLLLH